MNNKLYGNLIFELSKEGRRGYSLPKNQFGDYDIPASLCRNEDAALPECDEMTVVRHYTNHSENNFGVNNGFYPLGSCTMKYNPVVNEEVANMPEFTGLHPLQPAATVEGALDVCEQLQKHLSAIAGLSRFTLNPFAGAHGELTGLMIIRAYHESRGDSKRTKVIIPDSAHGTNPASAAVCGLEVVEVKSTAQGFVDVNDLRGILDDTVAAMMRTNPNTLGMFEQEIPEIAKLVHECGGLMYYDGANLNPMLGACRPGDMGFDVMHINLHKTFSTPHGGGGPGAGPVGVRAGLEQFLPDASCARSIDYFNKECCTQYKQNILREQEFLSSQAPDTDNKRIDAYINCDSRHYCNQKEQILQPIKDPDTFVLGFLCHHISQTGSDSIVSNLIGNLSKHSHYQ